MSGLNLNPGVGAGSSLINAVMSSLPNLLQAQEQVMGQMWQLNMYQVMSALGTALTGARSALQQQLMNEAGIKVGYRLAEMSTAMNTFMDASIQATKAATNVMQRSLELSNHMAQVREKVVNTFIQMEDQRSNNSWQRMKQTVQAMRY